MAVTVHSSSRDFRFVQEKPSEMIIYCANPLDLNQEIIKMSKDLTIFADRITINGEIQLPGKKVSIHARQIITNGNSIINVSGNKGEDAPNIGAGLGEYPGGTGKTGEDGKSEGGNGGNVFITAKEILGHLTILSNGGTGGNGQPGGDGSIGSTGPDGKNGECGGQFRNRNEDGGQGGKGGDGGNAGQGGKGRKGGNAGRIEIRLIQLPPDGTLIIKAEGGNGGKDGDHGSPGDGGPGGRGGVNSVFDPGDTNLISDPVDDLLIAYRDLLIDPSAINRRGIDRSIKPISYKDENDLTDSFGPPVEQLPIDDPDLELARSDRILFMTPRPRCIVSEELNGRGPTGEKGENGKPVEWEPGSGAKGDSSSVIIQQVDYKKIASEGSLSQWLMLLHYAEHSYLKADYKNCSISLDWLEHLTRKLPGFSETSSALPDSEEWNALRDRVVLLQSQLSAGLDFYGLPRNYVPLVALETYKATVKDMLDIATEIEKTYNYYWEKKDKTEDSLAALSSAITQITDYVNILKGQKTVMKLAAVETQKVQESLAVSLQGQEMKLREAEDDFQNALAAQVGCGFFDLLKFVTTVLSVVDVGYENIEKIVKNVDEIGKLSGNLKDILSKTVERLRVVQSSVDQLRGAYQQIKDLISVQPNVAKIIVEGVGFEETARKNVEEALERYKDIPEAQEFKRQIRYFLDLATAYNLKVMEYTALVIQYALIEAEIAQQAKEIDRIKDLKPKDHPLLVEHVAFIGKLLRRVKDHVIHALYQERRAYEFWALDEGKFEFVGDDVTNLKYTHETILASELRAKNRRSGSKQSFRGVNIVISKQDFPDTWASFQERGTLSFQIPLDHPSFAGLNTDLTVSSVKVNIPSAYTDNDELRIDLIQTGHSKFIMPDGVKREYTHRPRRCFIWYNMKTGKHFTPTENNLGGEAGEFAYLSPFAFWLLVLEAKLNPGLRLGKVEQIELEFDGRFLKGVP